MDDLAWLALTLTLSVASAVATWAAYRRRGLSAGLLGAAITLLFPAAYLTRTLRMLVRIGDAVVDWATALVFSPSVWIGVVLAGLAVVLGGASRVVSRRSAPPARDDPPAATRGAARESLGAGRPARSEPAVDDDLAEIEALLRKRGIS